MPANRANLLSLKVRRQKIEARRPIIAELLVKGWSVERIAKEVAARLNIKYCKSSCFGDIKAIKQQWQEEQKDYINTYMGECIARLTDVIFEARKAWEKSCEDYQDETMTRQGKPIKKGDEQDIQTSFLEKTTKLVRCTGDPKYLDQIMKAQSEICKLLGLYAPEKKDLTSNGNTIGGALQIEVIDSRDKVDNEDTDDSDIQQDR